MSRCEIRHRQSLDFGPVSIISGLSRPITQVRRQSWAHEDPTSPPITNPRLRGLGTVIGPKQCRLLLPAKLHPMSKAAPKA